MAGGALKQLIHQTRWGELDFLLIDLPPGTGDVHLTVAHEVKFDGAVIVSTPQSLAVADVRRGIEMFRSEGIDVPVWGIVENMAWFTPAELPDSRYYIFGRSGAREFAHIEGIDFLGEIPIEMSVVDSGERGLPSVGLKTGVKPYCEAIVAKIVEKAGKRC
jgi:ATP-binding protein involved in chromosome partitioning